MILQSLRELAEREHLVADPAFEFKPVRWQIELDTEGRFREVFDTNTPETTEGKKKPRLQAKMLRIPRRLGRSSGVRADFLVDNAKYALGLASDPTTLDPRMAECHEAFLKLLKEAPAGTPELDAVLRFLLSEEDRDRCAASLEQQGGFASNDLFAFMVDGASVASTSTLETWWSGRKKDAKSKGQQAQCLLCGEIRVPARLHQSIQIRGANSSGAPLVSFEKSAFWKYGLSGNENAPVCMACMTAYTEALRRLTRPQYMAPDGRTLQPLQTGLTDDTTAIYWSDGDSSLPMGLQQILLNPSSVGSLLLSPLAGEEYRLKRADRFFCLIVTGVQGRVSIRRLHTATVGDVVRNLKRYYAAISSGRRTTGAPLPIIALLRALAPQGEVGRLAPDLAAELWLAALFATPLPRSILSTLVIRNQRERSDARRGVWKVSRERAALLQFYFLSHGKDPTDNNTLNHDNDEELPFMGLNESSNDRAYVLGRVLAAAERMQEIAQPQLNRTVVDRFFAMASVRPQVVFHQIIEGYQHHKKKALRDRPGAAVNVDKLWGALLFKLEAEDSETTQAAFSRPLTLEEQGRFGLGYYHQRQAFLEEALARKEARLAASDDSTTNTAELQESQA